MSSSISQLLDRHEAMENSLSGDDAGNLLYGWQCENPFAERLLETIRQRANAIDHVKYSYLEDDEALAYALKQLHIKRDSVQPECIFCAAGGAVSILFTFCAYLHSQGIQEVHYIPPLYFTLHFALKLFGIRPRAISGLHAIEAEFFMNLPNKNTVLILTDPVWYAGCVVPEAVVETVREWQRKTESLIFVDGSFQYMRWDAELREPTSKLESSKTFRLISPTKQLGIHGYRFAYVLLPEIVNAKFTTTNTNIYGSTAAVNGAFAHESIAELESGIITKQMVCRAATRHAQLREQNKIASIFQPECGYFAFERIKASIPNEHLRMTGEFFNQPRYVGYSRLNLLSPSFSLLESAGPE
jgi:aspartate/methionine/tyrosine aminotransferase